MGVANIINSVSIPYHPIAAPSDKVTHISVNLVVTVGPVKITGSKPKRRRSVIQHRRYGVVVAAKTKVLAIL